MGILVYDRVVFSKRLTYPANHVQSREEWLPLRRSFDEESACPRGQIRQFRLGLHSLEVRSSCVHVRASQMCFASVRRSV